MLSDAQIREFRERGFIAGPRVMEDSAADDLWHRLEAVMAGKSSARPESNRNLNAASERIVVQVVNIWMADEAFQAHLYNPQVCAMVEQLVGHPVLRVWHDQIQYKPPRIGGPTDWHQDHPYWPIIQPADLVSAWVALDDAEIENGCMWMVPRSHRWGPHKGGTIGTNPEDFTPAPDLSLLPSGVVIEKVPCPVKKGHVMFHHCLTWHGSPPNHSNRGRPAIAVHYMPGYTRYEPVGTHLVEHRVTVKPGDVLEGEFFPTVWDHGPVAIPPLPKEQQVA